MKVGRRVQLTKIGMLPPGLFDRPCLIPGTEGEILKAAVFEGPLQIPAMLATPTSVVKFEIHFDKVPEIPKQDPIDMIVGWIAESNLVEVPRE
jgi:hypothetical protein